MKKISDELLKWMRAKAEGDWSGKWAHWCLLNCCFLDLCCISCCLFFSKVFLSSEGTIKINKEQVRTENECVYLEGACCHLLRLEQEWHRVTCLGHTWVTTNWYYNPEVPGVDPHWKMRNGTDECVLTVVSTCLLLQGAQPLKFCVLKQAPRKLVLISENLPTQLGLVLK